MHKTTKRKQGDAVCATAKTQHPHRYDEFGATYSGSCFSRTGPCRRVHVDVIGHHTKLCNDGLAMWQWWGISDLSSEDEEKQLYLAAEDGDLDRVAHYVRQLHLNAKDVYGQTILHWASANGIEKMVRLLLLQKEVDVDAIDINKQTPLHWACHGGHTAVVELLLEHGAEVNVKNIQGDPPLHLAFKQLEQWNREGDGWARSSLYIGKSRDIPVAIFKHRVNNTGNHADGGCYTEIVELLLAHGADDHVRDQNGQTLLHWASSKGNESAIRLLLKHGADMDNDGKTPLLIAKTFDLRACVAALELAVNCDSRAQLELKIKRLQQIVHAARDSLDPTIIANAIDTSRRLDLLLPLRHYKHIPTAEELQTEITKLEATMHHLPIGKEKLDHSIKLQGLQQKLRREMEAQRALNGEIYSMELPEEINMNAHRDDEKGLCFAAECGNLELALYYLGKRTNPNAESSNGRTPLSMASENGQVQVCRLLLEYGAGIDTTDADGRTPLHAAVEHGHKLMVTLLLEYGASVDVKNGKGNTPLEMARQMDFRKWCIDAFHPFVTFDTRAALDLEIQRLQQKVTDAKNSLDPNVVARATDAANQLVRLLPLCQCKRFSSAAVLQEKISVFEGKLGQLKKRLGGELAAHQPESDGCTPPICP